MRIYLFITVLILYVVVAYGGRMKRSEMQFRHGLWRNRRNGECGAAEKKELAVCLFGKVVNWYETLKKMEEAITSLNCTQHKALKACIEDPCTLADAIQQGSEITEVMTYDQDGSNFLHSYLALAFMCSTEGWKIVEAAQTCVNANNEGAYLMASINEMNDFYNQQRADRRSKTSGGPITGEMTDQYSKDWCNKLRKVSWREHNEVKSYCERYPIGVPAQEKMAYLACRTIVDAFVKYDPKMFSHTNCDPLPGQPAGEVVEFCPKPKSMEPSEPEAESNGDTPGEPSETKATVAGTGAEPQGRNGEATTGATTGSAMLIPGIIVIIIGIGISSLTFHDV